MLNHRATPPCAIAIIGCAGRFPGAENVAAFWRNLCAGVETVQIFAEAELEDAFGADVRRRPEFVRARSVLDGVENFDAAFFGMHVREAEMTDPQHRVFLECCWQALEDAGYDPAAYGGSIGVFAGSSLGSYLMRNVLVSRADVERFTSDYQVGSYPELLGAGSDFLATRVAYKLDLRGPAMTLQSACSTSLLAVAQACQTLMLRQADMMLAGAVSISFPQKRGYLYQEGGMVSPDGHCRTFDQRASGTVFGDGAGVVALKRLEDALADGDSVYAVIRGFGVNNDGSGKVGYTAPSVEGQAAAVRAAHAMAGVAAETIGFIECHGTATPLGDPIELAALHKAFGLPSGAPKSCALGSVKTNVGHLDVASGVTGLIKAALAIYHGKIPPTLHFSAPNPRIDLAAGPFFVNTDLAQWPNDNETRRAAVSSFGVGGTNVHLVLESGPQREAATKSDDAQLVVLSARSESALADARARLAAHLREDDGTALGNVAYTLQVGRRAFPFRCAVVARSTAEACDALERPDRFASGRTNERAPVVAFMFPGQGAQYFGMGRDLYDRVAAFRENIDRCADILRPLIDIDLRTVLYEDVDARKLTSTDIAQPALFAVEYALAEMLRSYGIVPAATTGHSVGEFVSACLAGVFSLEDALALVAERGRLMRGLHSGAMLAVRAGEAELVRMLDGDLDIAAFNAPELSVVSGPLTAIERFDGRLKQAGAMSRRLQTSHAFHSAMMDPVIAPLRRSVAAVRLNSPSSPYVSAVTGTWITPEEAASPDYWARHCREPVRFAEGLQSLVDGGVDTLIEVGPGASLATFALQGAAKGARATVLRTLPGNERERPDLEVALETVGRLWIAGAAPQWSALHQGSVRSRISLPSYPFERTRCWIEPQHTAMAEPNEPLPIPVQLPEIDPMERQISIVHPVEEPSSASRVKCVQRELVTLLEDLAGESLTDADPGATFLELGFDSLSLGRFVQQLQSSYGVRVSFRELLGDVPSIAALADYIVPRLPPDKVPAAANGRVAPEAAATIVAANAGTTIETFMREQLQAMQQLMREQLQALQAVGREVPASPAAPVPPSVPSAATAESSESQVPSRLNAVHISGAPRADATPAQRAHIDDLIARTVALTAESKRLTQRYRGVLADPRVAAGFRSEWKEMVYPVTCVRAKGSRIWDVDGNEYIDLLNGFGQTAFGHAPDFVVDAVTAQLQRGFAIGPQTPLAGEVAELFCELTGNERVTFCNTGSEAVMAALRVARTVTGRTRVVIFEGSYHGQFDEVLVKSARSSHRSLPVALGIPAEAVANIVVLPYGAPESLTWVDEHQHELAAVVVESVQSRHPALRPREFLLELRRITEASGTAFVFDEVVTGFRMHPGGMQAIFGIRADLATYGKVVGGGLPIGILAGKARFMDALDGGAWQYGDDSLPEVAPTFLAGTFVRHPLAMAAVFAVLRHLKAQGPKLQEALGARTATLVDRLNGELQRCGISAHIECYGSLFFLNFAGEDRLASLLFYHLRLRGVYVQEGFPSFLTTEHTDADVNAIVTAFAESLDELQSVGILAPRAAAKQHPDQQPTQSAPTEIPLTEEQTEIWLSAQRGDDASCAFNESVTLRLRGALNEAAFQTAWDRILLRHDALRGSFGTTGEKMHIAWPEPSAFSRSDVSGRSVDEREAVVRKLIDDEARKPFDLAHGPLTRGHLVCLAPAEHAFVFTAHHIVCDGWSMNVLLDELGRSYAALSAGTAAQLAEPLAFASYARRQAQRDPAQHDRVEAYWLEQFQDEPALLALPTDRPRPAQKTFHGATRMAFVDRDTYRTIKKGGAAHGCTLFVTLLAAFEILIARLADQNDVVVGVPTAGQALLDGEILIGHCVDFLPIRVSFAPATSLAEFLVDVKRRVLDAYEHQQYTLGTLVRKLGFRRERSRVPLAEVQFNLERLAADVKFGSLDVKVEPNPKAFVNFDLFLNVVESDGGLRIDCDYNTDLFDAATIDRWLCYYRRILEEILRDASQTVTGVNFLLDAERRVLAELNDTAEAYSTDQTVHELLRETMTLRGEATAVRFGDEALSYAALRRRINQAANHLLARIGGSPRRVAICVQRSCDLIVALLGTLNAGYCYVPLDPTHPPKRLRQIIEDAGVAAVICDGSADPAIIPNGVERIDLRESADTIASMSAAAPSPGALADDPAYVIYTSGSTGTPKGVEVTHRSVVNLLTSMSRSPGLCAHDVLLAVTTVSFDIAALELFLPLFVGATVVIASHEDVVDAQALVRRMRTVRPTIMQATPALWGMLLAVGLRPPAGLKILCGGEALSRDLANRLVVEGADLWNVYGPTETTIWSSCRKIELGEEPISVGRPIANTQFYVLDSNDCMRPMGVVGQLHIAGDGVARGYVNNPELTNEKFVPNPFGPGRMYRTGDAARVTSDGRVQVLGRLDHQIKLRGFRIELGEVEAIVLKETGFAAVAVILREDFPGDRRLACYYVDPSQRAKDAPALRMLVAEDLPEYMIPSVWIKLEQLPLSAAGKVDRSALPAPQAAPPSASFREPQTLTEITLARIWSEVLHLERVSLDDDFFALGGDSIQLFQITARANQSGLRLAAKELLRQPTVAALASKLDETARTIEAQATSSVANRVTPLRSPQNLLRRKPHTGQRAPRAHTDMRALTRSEPPITASAEPLDGCLLFPCSQSQKRFWLETQLHPDNPGLNVAVRWRLEGDVCSAHLDEAWSVIIERHQTLRTTFSTLEGEPYQVVHPSIPFRLPVIDLTALGEEEARAEAERIASREAQQTFDLTVAPLIRVTHVRVRSDVSMILVTAHHAVCDGWSVGILAREMGEICAALQTGRQPELQQLSVTYADYALWEREWLSASTALVREKVADRLRGFEQFEIVADMARPSVQTSNADIASVLLERSLTDAASELARTNRCTLFITAYSTLLVLLHHYSGETDIVLGSQVAGRDEVEFEPLVGTFINTIALRTDVSGDPTFEELLARASDTVSDALELRYVPLEELVKIVNPKRDLSRNALFSINFVLQRSFIENGAYGAFRLIDLPSRSAGPICDLNFFMVQRPEGWRISCEFNTDLYRRSTVDRILHRFVALLQAVVVYPNQPISGYVDVDVLRTSLSEKPPSFMSPSAVIPLPAVPLSTNGKVNHGALAAPTQGQSAASASHHVATEASLARMLGELLGVDPIERDVNIFALGFHSLLAVRLVAIVKETFRVELSLRALFEQPTLAAIAAQIDGSSQPELTAAMPIVTLNANGTRTPFIFFHGDLFADGRYAHSLASALPDDQPICAVAPHGTAGLPLVTTIEEMAHDYAFRIRTVQPRGPYSLGGFCASGLAAYELARILRSQGEVIERLVLINSSPMPRKRIPVFDSLIRRFGLDVRLEASMRERICYNLARLHAAAVTGLPATASVARRMVSSLTSRSQTLSTMQEPQPFEKRRGMKETENSFAHVAAALTYHPKPYDGDVVLLWSEDQCTLFNDPTFGWGALANRVEVSALGGGKIAALSERIEELADVLDATLVRSVKS